MVTGGGTFGAASRNHSRRGLRRAFRVAGTTFLGAAGSLLICAPGSAVNPPGPVAGLVLDYTMESLPEGTVPDASPNGLTGHLMSSGQTPQLRTSLQGYGRSLELVGAQQQFVDVPLSPTLDVDQYTLSAWVRYTGAQNDKSLGRWEVLEKAGAYWINVRTDGQVRVGGFYGGCTVSSWRNFNSVRTIPTLRWTHLAVTHDSTSLRLYINGRAAGAIPVAGTTCASGQPLAVGAKNAPAKGVLEAFWDGRLDEVRVYNRALTVDEIRQLAVRP